MAVACGHGFTAVVVENGDLWTCGRNDEGQLGLDTGLDRYEDAMAWRNRSHGKPQTILSLVGGADKVFEGEAVVMVAAGKAHTACVTTRGKCV